MRRFFSVSVFLLMLINILFVPTGDIPCARASPSVYQGDLILAGDNVTVIEGRFDINGSIIVEENATLHLKNAFLNFTQCNVRQHNITLRHPSNGNPRLVAHNSTITSYSRLDVILEDNCTATIDNCTFADATAHIIARDQSNLSILNSSVTYLFARGSSAINVYNSTIRGDWHNYDCAQVQVYNSEISSLVIGPESVNCTISTLEQGFISNWSFVTNCSVNILPEGSTPNVTFINTRINYLRFAFYGNSNVTISNSTIGEVFAIGGSSVIHLESTTCNYVYANSLSTMLVTNCTLSRVEAHANAAIHVSNSTIDMYPWSTVFVYARDLANCSIVNLESDITNYWNFEHNCSVVVASSGHAPNFTLINTKVGAWSFGFSGTSNVTISNSDLLSLQLMEQVHTCIFNSFSRGHVYCVQNSKTYLHDSTLEWLYCTGNSRIWTMNSTTNKLPRIYDQSIVVVSWNLNLHVIDSIGENITSASVTATYPNATLAECKLTDENGWSNMMLMEKTMNATGAYPVGNYTVEASYWSYFNHTAVNMTGNRDIILTLDGFVLPSTIFIRPNGTVDPSAAPIQHAGNLYTLTDNIYLSIIVQRSDIVIDGAGHTLQGYGSGQGFDLFKIDDVTIQNTNIRNFDCGIDLRFCSNITVSTNRIMANNDCGICLHGSSNNTVSENNITGNYYAGISLFNCSKNCVSKNNVTENYVAIYLYESLSASVFVNSIFTNILTNNYVGVLHWNSSNSDIFANTIANNGIGIGLYYSLNNSISGNTLTANNNTAIVLGPSSSYNSIYENNVTKNEDGISIYDSSNNSIYGNNLAENRYGITLSNSSSNIVHHNSFINNTKQVYDDSWDFPSSHFPSINTWDDGYPSGGNYWSNYNGTDLHGGVYQNEPGSDGIGDTSYVIDVDNVDHYPLMSPYGAPPPQTHNLAITTMVGGTTIPAAGTYIYTIYSIVEVTAVQDAGFIFDHWELNGSQVGSANPYSVFMNADYSLHAVFVAENHDLAVIDTTVSRTLVGQGYNISIIVTVVNQGAYTENFNVTVYANATIINTPVDITLTSGNSTIIVFVWSTTEVAKGNYVIIANATEVPGETDTADNTYVDGVVTVTIPGDVDGDFDVDIYDVVKLCVAYGSKKGDLKYDANCDLDGDGDVDIYDIVLMCNHYGETHL